MFLRRLHGSRGLLAAQLHVNVLEAQQLLDRTTAPVLHRERWYPVRLRASDKGRGGAATLRLGQQPMTVLGPQTGSEFQVGHMFQLGGYADYADVVVYPLDPTVVRLCTAVTDSITDPTTILVAGKDFTVEQGSICFRRTCDPFESGAFSQTMITTDGQPDQQITLWCCDTLFDLQYTYEHLGYCFGMRVESTAYFKRLINAVWDARTNGSTIQSFGALVAAIYDVPVVLDETDTIEQIVTDVNGDQLVITALQVYRYPSTAVLRNWQPGDTVRRGDMLDTSLLIYSNITDTEPTHLAGVRDGDWFRTAVPTVTLPSSFFRAPLQYGLTARWGLVPIICYGLDQNQNPKLGFELIGDPTDVSDYWNDVWATAEAQNISMETCFTPYLNAIVDYTTGSECGYVDPLAYWLRNLIGANSVFVSVDTRQLRTDRVSLGNAYADMLREVLPAYTHLFVVERRSPTSEQYDMSQTDSQAEQYMGRLLGSTATAGRQSKRQLCYYDTAITRWVPTCR
jgi:hypothetical protein